MVRGPPPLGLPGHEGAHGGGDNDEHPEGDRILDDGDFGLL